MPPFRRWANRCRTWKSLRGWLPRSACLAAGVPPAEVFPEIGHEVAAFAGMTYETRG